MTLLHRFLSWLLPYRTHSTAEFAELARWSRIESITGEQR
jgi:hypothetical protein